MFARGFYYNYLRNVMVSQFLLARKLLAGFKLLTLCVGLYSENNIILAGTPSQGLASPRTLVSFADGIARATNDESLLLN